MDVKPNIFTITIQEAEWIASAISADRSRPELAYAAIAHYEGYAVLVSTDLYRLHLLRLCPCEAFDTVLLDIERVVYEAQYYGSRKISIDMDEQSVTLSLHHCPSVSSRLVTCDVKIDTPVFINEGKKFPGFTKPIPKAPRPVSEFVAINWKYFESACALAVNDANKIMLVSDRAISSPIMIVGPTDRWLAVLMPMLAYGFAFGRENE